MADLVESYNALTGKSIKKFESLEVGRVRVANAILAAEDRTAHAGVSKGEKPKAKTVEELPLKIDEVVDDADTTTKEEDMKTEKQSKRDARYPQAAAQEAAAKAKAKGDKPQAATAKKVPAKKAAAKKVAAKKGAPAKKAPAAKKAATPRHNVYEKVKLTEPDTTRRPQEGSNRSLVLKALQKRKAATIDQLSDDVGFNARSYVHKLVFQGWAEVVPA